MSRELSTSKASRRNVGQTARGFTLLEVLAALVVVGIVLPIVFSALSLVVTTSADARKRTQATALAESKLQELTAGRVLQTQSGTNASGDFGPALADFRWQAVTSVADVATEIDLRVFWISKTGERSIDLSTFVYDSTNASTSTGVTATGGGS